MRRLIQRGPVTYSKGRQGAVIHLVLRRVNLLTEPYGEIYERLLDFCLDYCDMASLVELFPLSEDGFRFMEKLALHLVSTKQGSSWPGTITAQIATLYSIRYCADSAHLLKKAVCGLYGWGEFWQQSERRLLEDLCLFRTTGEPFLVTIGHEHDAFLDLTDEELAIFRKQFPELPVEVTAWEPLCS